MTQRPDPLREMASALVDGEASEFECRRLLGSPPDPALSALIARHYTVRSLLRREGTALCPPELTRSVLDAIAAEPLPGVPAVASSWQRWAGGAAVAASVCLVAVMGVGMPTSTEAPSSRQLAALGTPVGALGSPASVAPMPRTAAMPVGFGQGPGVADTGDRAAERRLRAYMFEHAQNAALSGPQGMIPFVRVVSHEEP